jgi:hypothetical protein
VKELADRLTGDSDREWVHEEKVGFRSFLLVYKSVSLSRSMCLYDIPKMLNTRVGREAGNHMQCDTARSRSSYRSVGGKVW